MLTLFGQVHIALDELVTERAVLFCTGKEVVSVSEMDARQIQVKLPCPGFTDPTYSATSMLRAPLMVVLPVCPLDEIFSHRKCLCKRDSPIGRWFLAGFARFAAPGGRQLVKCSDPKPPPASQACFERSPPATPEAAEPQHIPTIFEGKLRVGHYDRWVSRYVKFA